MDMIEAYTANKNNAVMTMEMAVIQSIIFQFWWVGRIPRQKIMAR
jgi:hypothetical protein